MQTTGKGFEQNIPLLLFIQRSGVPAVEICRDLISRKGLVPAECVGTVALEGYPCTVISDKDFEKRTDLMVKCKVDSESIGFTREQLMSADFVTANIGGCSAIADALFSLRPVTIVQARDSTRELIANLVAGGMTENMATARVEHEEGMMVDIKCNLDVTCWGHTVEEISDNIVKYHEYRRDMFVKRLSPPVPKPEVQEVRVRYPRLPIVGKFFIAILIALFVIAQLLMISCLTDIMGRLDIIQRDLNNMEVKYYGLVEDLESTLNASIDEPGRSGRPEIVPNSAVGGSESGAASSSSVYQAKPYFVYDDGMTCPGMYDEFEGCYGPEGCYGYYDYEDYDDYYGWHEEYNDHGGYGEWHQGRVSKYPVTTEREKSGEPVASESNVAGNADNGSSSQNGDANKGSTHGSVVSNSTAQSANTSRADSVKGGGDR